MRTRNVTVWVVAVVALVLCGQARADLVAHWQFDEGEGDIAYDSVGINDGTIYGAQWTDGKIGDYALDFDGDDDFVELPDNEPVWLPRNNFTLSVWVYFENDASAREFLLDLNSAESGHSTRRLGYYLSRRTTGLVRFYMVSGESSFDDLTGDTVILGQQWYHIVAVRDGTTQAIYVNGQLDKSKTCSSSPIDFAGSYDDNNVSIGRYSRTGIHTPRYVNGAIDDVRVYDQALSAEEIQQLYREGLGASEFAVIQIEDAIAEKEEILEAIDETLAKEWAAHDALEQLLESKKKDYDGLKKGDIVKAKQKIHSAIQHQQQSADALEKSIKKLEEALAVLYGEPEPESDPNLVSYWQFDEGQDDIAKKTMIFTAKG